jgi:putative ABC transport system permease protein
LANGWWLRMNKRAVCAEQDQQNRTHGISITAAFGQLSQREQQKSGRLCALRLAGVMAWRDARASWGKFAVAALPMAVAAAMVCAVRGVTVEFSGHVLNSARQWIASDVTIVYYGHALTPEQWTAVRAQPEIAAASLVTEADATAWSEQAPDPVTVSLKAVDPAVYPFYGRLELRSKRPLSRVLDASSVIVSPEVLESLQVRVGDRIRLNRAEFRIQDVIFSEPDEFAIPQAPIGRIIASQEGLERSDLVGFGGSAYYRILARTRPGIDRRPLCSRLEQMFPEAKVIDYTSRMPQTTAALDWIVPFLNVVAFLSIVVGATGIAAAAYFHLLQREESVATLKALGATGSQILSIYLLQTLGLALIGFIAGAAFAPLVVWSIGRLAARYFNTQIATALGTGVTIESAVLILAVAAGAAWMPLSRIHAIRPWVLLRRDIGERREFQSTTAVRWNFSQKRKLIAPGVVIAALVLFRTVDSWRVGTELMLGIGSAVLAMHAIARATFTVLFRAARAGKHRVPWVMRQGIVNLCHYQRRSGMVIALLTSGVALMVIALLGHSKLNRYVLDAIPFHAPNLLFVQVRDSQTDQLSSFLARQPGVLGQAEFVPSAWVTLTRSNNRTLAELRAAEPSIWIQNTWSASCLDAEPASLDVIEGHWWRRPPPENVVALDQEVARLFRTGVGGTLEFVAAGHPVRARIAALVRMPPAQRLWLHEMVFNCAALPAAVYSGAVGIAPRHLHEVQQLLHQQLPEVTFLNVERLLRQSERIGREAASILQLFAGLIVSAAACLLIAVIHSLRLFRVYEIAVFRFLGARRTTLMLPLVVEYSAVGALAGLLGGTIGCLATSLILFQATGRFVWTFDLKVILSAVAGGAIVTAVAGLLGSIGLFHPKPLEILRRH